MAKPLSHKSHLIRQAIKDNPNKGSTEIAEMLNDAEERMDDKINVKPGDVSQQRQAMKKGGGAAASTGGNGRGKKGGRKGGVGLPEL